jgi:hypothetical protein
MHYSLLKNSIGFANGFEKYNVLEIHLAPDKFIVRPACDLTSARVYRKIRTFKYIFRVIAPLYSTKLEAKNQRCLLPETVKNVNKVKALCRDLLALN